MDDNGNELIGVSEAARRLGVSRQRVRALIQDKRLPAQMVADVWVIQAKDLELVKDRKEGWRKGRKRSKPKEPPDAEENPRLASCLH